MKLIKRFLAVVLLLGCLLMLFGPWMVFELNPPGEQLLSGNLKTLAQDSVRGMGEILSNTGKNAESTEELLDLGVGTVKDGQLSPVETVVLLRSAGAVLDQLSNYKVFGVSVMENVEELNEAAENVVLATKILLGVLAVYLVLWLVATLGTCSGHYGLLWMAVPAALVLTGIYVALTLYLRDAAGQILAELETSLAFVLPADSGLSVKELLDLQVSVGFGGVAATVLPILARILCLLPEEK